MAKEWKTYMNEPIIITTPFEGVRLQTLQFNMLTPFQK